MSKRDRADVPPLPESVRMPVRRVTRQGSEGTARLIQLLQQVAEQ